ncbi:putative methyltransferase-like protein 24 [Babylonia areolata]|uniref:putative methyltransferase-like protein 24 n=1 Tax=Babylonia areolata TaxID=304850 RepID=UPI003FD38959
MRRLRTRQCVYLCTTIIFVFLVVYVFLYTDLSKKRMSVSMDTLPQMDVEMAGLGLPIATVKPKDPPKPLFIPQIHVKTLPQPRVLMNMTETEAEHNFFKYLENKDVRCNNDMRLGHPHDGGWNVCLSPPFSLLRPCVVMSFGIGRDWQFDDSVAKIYGCKVLAYDPSIVEMSNKRSSLIEFKRIGIGPKNMVNTAGWKLKTLGTLIREEGLEGRLINYVKIDIEYSEWDVLKTIYEEESLRNVQQFGFEMHTRELFRVSNINMPTKKKDFVKMYKLLRPLEEKFNFRKFNYRRNPFGDYKSNITGMSRSCCYELHYLNMNLVNKTDMIEHHKDSKLFH